ncbi:MAG TPA: polyphosphate kinase 2 [Acidimicrobiales bacterium]
MADEAKVEPPTSITEMEREAPYSEKLSTKEYLRELRLLQIELLKLQRHVVDSGAKVVVIFEGRDAAGKGGAIRRFTEHLNPRSARIVALPKPTDTERGQWYFQRYTQNLPTTGEMVFFDRSWYNRAGVEKVMGFCTPKEYGEFFRQVPGFEQSLVESGISLFKLWFTVSRENQQKRFEDRQQDPLRQWKFSAMDKHSQARWQEYSTARDAMLIQADSDIAPWTVVNSNEKKRARLESIRHLVHRLDYDHKDPEVSRPPDERVVQRAMDVFAAGS